MVLFRHTFNRCELLCNFITTWLTLNKGIQFNSVQLSNDLRLRILGNKEILGKSSFQKINFGNSSQKARKSRNQTFLFFSRFTGFLYFVPNILLRIVETFIFVLSYLNSNRFCCNSIKRFCNEALAI